MNCFGGLMFNNYCPVCFLIVLSDFGHANLRCVVQKYLRLKSGRLCKHICSSSYFPCIIDPPNV